MRIFASMNIVDIDNTATAATDLLKALASPNRIRILCHLVDGEKSVGRIALAIGVREATVSQHLSLLRRDRVVSCRRSGQTVFYTLVNPTARRLLDVLHELFCPDGQFHPDADLGRNAHDA